jgi:diguanylate cyclase (GGDEF)-like protein
MPTNLLLVDDDAGAIQLMARILSDTGALRFAMNGDDALRMARANPPDLVLLDAEMPGISGFEVCAAMKADPALAKVPVIFVTSHSSPEFELAGLELGAVDFIAKPFSEPLVRARVRTQLRLKHLLDELLRLSTTDALTQLSNRRHLDEVLAHEWTRGLRAGDPIALLMIDVDHFKRYNDRYGHPAGDAALQAVAHALGGSCQRPADVVARYGGEEFAILLPQTPRAGAMLLARRVVERVAALGIAHDDSPTGALLSVSVGVGCYSEATPRWAERAAGSSLRRDRGALLGAGDLVIAADRALYQAKSAGRGRAVCLDLADVDAPTLPPPPAADADPALAA